MQDTSQKDRIKVIATPSAPILSVVNLGRRFQDHWVWQAVSFEVNAGDRLAVVGPSGAGKSLLLRALAGLDPIQAGEILFQGQPLSDLDMPGFRTQVTYLHQKPALLEGTVESNLQQIYRLKVHRHKTYDRAQILNYLSLLGRTETFLTRSVEQLSGGEQQIVACLRSLQLDPQVLLLDEPTASLDNTATQQLEALLHQWQQRSSDHACIWTSHDPAQLERVTMRQIALRQNDTINRQNSDF
ncbi:MAG: ATP-binding cassette domain-containing protein [Cyanobacteria bacterium P01_G01_bin.54]